MATSGSKSISVTSWNTLKFSWWENSQSIANNETVIGWKMELISGSSGRIDSSASKNWAVSVNGKAYSGTNTVGIGNNATKTLASGTTTIKHDSNGKKTFSYSFSQQFSITFSGASIGTKSGSGSGTLDTIARKSTLSANNGTLGTAQNLAVTRQDSSLTHTITYKCGSASGTIATKSSDTSISWTPPLSLAQQNKTGTSVSITFTITTYSGSTSIGSNTKTITCSIPSSVKPTVSLAVSDTTGNAGTYGGYIQGRSKMQIDATASGSQGSTIKSYKITADDKTYTSESVTTGVIVGSGDLEISVTVTDSRGRTATAKKTISVLAYAVPQISSVTVKRCNADGTSNSSGSYFSVAFSSKISPLGNKNSATYKVKYKKTTETAYTTATLTDFANQYSVSNGVYIFPADSSSYDIILTAADAFNTAEKARTGSSIKKLWSILQKGLGIAIGKIAELEGVFDVDLIIRARKGIEVDSEWIPLTMVDPFIVRNGDVDLQPVYKVTANIVTIMGVVSPKEAVPSNSSGQVFAKGIPAKYRPHMDQHFVCQASGMNKWLCSVKTDGTLMVSRHGGTDYVEFPANVWLPFSVTYQF